jgi:hypothetical protein
MASQQVRQLAAQLADDADFRRRFRRDPRSAVSGAGYMLTGDELGALDAVDWAGMPDDELMVRLSGAAKRLTHQTA